MTKKPDSLRAGYLSGSGIFGQFFFPYYEELDKMKFFLKTMEDFVADSEKEEVSALEKGIEGLTAAERDEYWQWHYQSTGKRYSPIGCVRLSSCSSAPLSKAN